MPQIAEFEIPRACVLTIQGGGALGVELIGQLQGVTGAKLTRSGVATGDREMNAVGISGTSAGAIIATLFWAGYAPREILTIVTQTFSPAMRETFFGPYNKREISSFAALERFMARAAAVLSGSWKPERLAWLMPKARLLCAQLRLGVHVFFRNGWAFQKKGLIKATGFVDEIDRLLKASPYLREELNLPTNRPLTFRDVRERPSLGMVPLFLMVTDVSQQSLRIVSSIDDDALDLPIALAVRASAGFPIFFQPVTLDDKHLCCIDGGVISNVPTWVFSETFRGRLRNATSQFVGEAEMLRSLAALPWHHISLRLGPDEPPGYPESGPKFLIALWKLLSGVGRRHLEDTLATFVAIKRFVVEPPPPIPVARPVGTTPRAVGGVLDFAALGDKMLVDGLFRRGRECAQRAIDPARFVIPEATAVLPILEDLIAKVTTVLGPYLVPGTLVRANVFLPKSADTMAIAYAANMQGDLDAQIRIAHGKAVTSLCYLYGEPLLANLRDKLLDAEVSPAFDPFMPEVRPDRTWLLCMPILDALDLRPRAPSATAGLVMDADGPIYGTLNVDASVVYGGGGLDPNPVLQGAHPGVRLAFDATKVAARALGLLMNHPWL